jgi:hypothetical protein
VKTEFSPTWILFASGNSVKIELSLYDPAADRNRPITAYIVSDVGSDVARSASRAAETVFKIAHARNLAPPPTVAGFDLQGLTGGSQIAGHSSGLALALALAKRLWPQQDPGPIAATGEISSSSDGGLVQKISQIEAKTEAALNLLDNGGCFFYPAGNDPEISSELKNKLKDSGIKICPINCVIDALSIAFPEKFGPVSKTAIANEPHTEFAATTTIPTDKSCHNLKFLLAATGMILLILAGSLYMARKNSSTTSNSTPQTPNTVKPAPAATPPLQSLHISITGNSTLTKVLAQRTNSRLKAFLDSDRKCFRNLEAVNGQIKILSIKERWSDIDNTLNVNISAVMSGRVTLKNATQYKLELEPVSSSGPEPVQQQLTDVATLLVEQIGDALQNPPQKGQISIQPDKKETTPPADSSNRKDKNGLRNRSDKGFE